MTFNRLTALFLLLLASAWVALVNGQPLFMADTTAYVRGPDFAVVYFFGPKFASSWTQKRTLDARQAPSELPSKDASLNAPFDKAVLAGRSIYYGALLYIGHLTSYFWLTIFAQAAIFLYLTYTLAIKCLRLSFFTFSCVITLLLIATPVSFFISFLMPDVFVSFLALGAIILATFWNELDLRDKILISAITGFAALTHTSHLLLLMCLATVFGVFGFFAERKAGVLGSFYSRLAILFTLVLVGICGEVAFVYVTRNTIGADPIRPPFLTARLIADGPGYQFLQKHCASRLYIICKYIDRLPIPADTFLWSADPKSGVFSVADLATRSALSSEQIPFVLAVLRSNPVGVAASVTENIFHQLVTVGPVEFFNDKTEIDSFKEKLPTYYSSALQHARLIFRAWILTPLTIWYSSTYMLSALFLVAALTIFPSNRKRFEAIAAHQWLYVISGTALAIVFNAAICGALSQPTPRYQARISWICFFVAALLVASYFEAVSNIKSEPDFVRRAARTLPRSLRFLGIGSIGLATDLASFTIFAALGMHALIARIGSLAIATLVTWRLNRALTFDPSGRRQRDEAVRYAIVTIIAQGTSYAIFAALVLTVLITLPQVAILIGAAIGALLSYNGHLLLSFAPKAIYSSPP